MMELVFSWHGSGGWNERGLRGVHVKRIKLTPELAMSIDFAVFQANSWAGSYAIDVDDDLEIQVTQHGEPGAGIGEGLVITCGHMRGPRYVSSALSAGKYAKVQRIVAELKEHKHHAERARDNSTG
jgi:hypothetical protein